MSPSLEPTPPQAGPEAPSIARSFARQMAVLIVMVSVALLCIVFLLFSQITASFARKLSENQAGFVAQQVAGMIGEMDEPGLWEFSADKISKVLAQAMRPVGVKSVRILNLQREVVAEKSVEGGGSEGRPAGTAVPILFNNAVQGYMEVFTYPPGLSRARIYFTAIFIGSVLFSGVLFFFVPVRVVRGLESSLTQAYAKLKGLNEELERKVLERTSDLDRALRDLKKSQEMLIQSEKMSAVGQLAAGVAHEINNPLSVILGFAQGISLRIHPGDPFEKAVRSIEREALRCRTLVQDLLTFSRSDTDKSEHAPLELNGVIEETLRLVEAGAKVNGVAIHLSLSAGLPRILGNRNQIQQAVINLVNNAVDAMPKGGTLRISTERLQDQSFPEVCLTLSDTGAGIPREIQSKIFEPFFTTKPAGKGTGLGLSLVFEIVKKHSGTIEVRSEPGRTQFFLKFPTH